MPILKVVNLCIDYAVSDGVRRVLDGVSLTVDRGETLGVLGRSGSGKSVLARAILGLTRELGRVMDGEILFDNHNLLLMPEDELQKVRGKQIGLIVSNPLTRLNPLISVGSQIANVLRAKQDLSVKEAFERATGLLALMSIADPPRVAHMLPNELSGGMCQRVVIAMGLANDPPLLVADEPTFGLDVTVQRQVLDEMTSLARERDAALLLMTRDLGIVAHFCDRVAVLQEGQIVELEEVRGFFKNPQHPHSRFLLRASFAARGEGLLGPSDGWAHPHMPESREDTLDGGPLLTVDGLAKEFKLRGSREVVHAVNGISFEIQPGETLALVGESGSGKTTVGRCILKLVDFTSGRIHFKGQDVSAMPDRHFRHLRPRIQLVFQEPDESLNPRLSIRDILDENVYLEGRLDKEQRKRRLLELLDMVRLPHDVLDMYPHELTGGEQQRIGIARAISTQPDLVILDEPTSNLDISARAEIIELLIRLQREFGLSYLFISHDLTAVRMISDRVAIMYLGKLAEVAPTKELFQHQIHPYGQALLSSVLFPDPDAVGRDRVMLKGEIPSPVDLPKGCFLHPRCPFAQEKCCHDPPPPMVGYLEDRRKVACCFASDFLPS